MNFHMIRSDDMLNGDGLRVIIFLSGCEHRCPGCHNPETWDPNSGEKFDKSAFDKIVEELRKDYISGITISGGDPLFKDNAVDVNNMLSCVRDIFGDSKTVWLYTGYSFEDIVGYKGTDTIDLSRKSIIEQCDVVCDGRFMKDLADVNCPWVGSTNQRVIDVPESLSEGRVIRAKIKV